MAEYDVFAKYYDLLMTDVDYTQKTEYVMKIFEKFGKIPTLLLDVGCGTGGFSLEFSKKNIDVIGVDISEEMLFAAHEKAVAQNADILFLHQSASALDLYGTVDGAVCFMDTVNHIIDEEELQESFNRISLFLELNSLFVFDVNTLYKHEKILADNTFVLENSDVYCVWQNFYDSENFITDIVLDFFEKKENYYIRNHDEFSERAYKEEKLIYMLEKSGFKTEAVFEENSFNKPSKTSQRNIFVARKVK